MIIIHNAGYFTCHFWATFFVFARWRIRYLSSISSRSSRGMALSLAVLAWILLTTLSTQAVARFPNHSTAAGPYFHFCQGSLQHRPEESDVINGQCSIARGNLLRCMIQIRFFTRSCSRTTSDSREGRSATDILRI